MDRVLVVDFACSRCKGLTAEIRQESDGLLDVRSLNDAHVHDLLARARPDWRREPTLIEVEGGAVGVFTGVALRTRLIAVLGLRRALRVAELVARSQTDLFTESRSRRTILQRGTSVAAGVAGLALLGPTPTWLGAIPVAAADKDKDKDKGKKPGKYSRKEGIEEWKVDKTPDGYKVKFEHEKKKLSGRVNITIGGHSAEVTLSRDGKNLSIATNANAETFAVVDAQGRAMSASWSKSRREWTMTAQGERILEENKRDIDIAIAVTSDL